MTKLTAGMFLNRAHFQKALAEQSMNERELEEIRQENFEALKGRDVVILIKSDYGWEVANWLASGSIAPTTGHDTPQEAAARALQLMGLTEAVKPQDWPESIQVKP